MLQQVMTNPGEIIFREVPVPEVKDDQVKVSFHTGTKKVFDWLYLGPVTDTEKNII